MAYGVKKVEVTQEQYDRLMELWSGSKLLGLTKPTFALVVSTRRGSFDGAYSVLNSMEFGAIFMTINGHYTITDSIVEGDWVRCEDGKLFFKGCKHLRVKENVNGIVTLYPLIAGSPALRLSLDLLEKVTEEEVIAYRDSRIKFYNGDLVSFKNPIDEFIVGTVKGIKDDMSEAYFVDRLDDGSTYVARGNDSIQLICLAKDRKDIIVFKEDKPKPKKAPKLFNEGDSVSFLWPVGSVYSPKTGIIKGPRLDKPNEYIVRVREGLITTKYSCHASSMILN